MNEQCIGHSKFGSAAVHSSGSNLGFRSGFSSNSGVVSRVYNYTRYLLFLSNAFIYKSKMLQGFVR